MKLALTGALALLVLAGEAGMALAAEESSATIENRSLMRGNGNGNGNGRGKPNSCINDCLFRADTLLSRGIISNCDQLICADRVIDIDCQDGFVRRDLTTRTITGGINFLAAYCLDESLVV